MLTIPQVQDAGFIPNRKARRAQAAAKSKQGDPAQLQGALNVQQSGPEQAMRSLRFVDPSSPDLQARALRVSALHNVTPQVARDLIQSAEGSQSTFIENDVDRILRGLSTTQQWLSNPNNVQLAYDDVEALSHLERALKGGSKSERSFGRELAEAGGRGLLRMGTVYGNVGVALGALDIDHGAEITAQFNRIQRDSSARSDPDIQLYRQRVGDALEEGGFGIIPAGLSNIEGFVALSLEQIGQLVGRAVGAGVGGAAGSLLGPGGAAAGIFEGQAAVGVATEFGFWVNEELQRAGYDIYSGKSLASAYRNPAVMKPIYAEALAKGITITAFDTLSALVGGRFLRKALNKGKGATRAAIAEGVEQTVLEGVGEAASQFAVGGVRGELPEGILGESLFESLISGPTSVAEVAFGVARRRAAKRGGGQALAEIQEASQAVQDAQTVRASIEAWNGTKVSARSPERLAQLVDAVDQDLVVRVDIEAWDEFWVGKDESPAEQVPEGPAAYQDARETGFIEMSVGAFLVDFADDPVAAELIQIATLRDGAPITKEAESTFKQIDKDIEQALDDTARTVQEGQELQSQATEAQTTLDQKQLNVPDATAATAPLVDLSPKQLRGIADSIEKVTAAPEEEVALEGFDVVDGDPTVIPRETPLDAILDALPGTFDTQAEGAREGLLAAAADPGQFVTDLRARADALSQQSDKQAAQEALDKIQARIDELAQDQSVEGKAKQAELKLALQVQRELEGAGRGSQQSEYQARFYASTMAVFAERLGIPIEALAKKFPFSARGATGRATGNANRSTGKGGGTTLSQRVDPIQLGQPVQSRKGIHVEPLGDRFAVVRDGIVTSLHPNRGVAEQRARTKSPDKPLLSDELEKRVDKAGHKLSEKTRGKRKRISTKAVKVSKEELAIVDKIVADHGLKKAEVIAYIRSAKAAHPVSDGWLPLVVVGVNKHRDPEKTLSTALAVKWGAIKYSFHTGGDSKAFNGADRQRAVKRVAARAVKSVRDVVTRAEAGDENALVILRQRAWYSNMVGRLFEEFGGNAEIFVDLLGALSPNTPVETNFKFAIDAIRQFSRGEFDVALEAYASHLAAGRMKKDYTGPIVLQSNGKKFSVNTFHAMDAMLLARWRQIESGSAPKAKNFSWNLSGWSVDATIDVWAARFLQRAAGKKRVPPLTEVGVGGHWSSDVERVTGPFGFGQEAMEIAAVELGMDASDLQALVWFSEKEIWTRNGWTTKKGESGSFEEELDALVMQRWIAGISTERPNFPHDVERASAIIDVLNVLREDDDVVAFRAPTTSGVFLWGDELSFDMEVTVNEGWDPTAWRDGLREVSAQAEQDAFFTARILKEGETVENAAPGLEARFAQPMSVEEAVGFIDAVKAAGFPGVTMVRDPRQVKPGSTDEQFSAPTEFIGFRVLWIKEFLEKGSTETAEDARDRLSDLRVDLSSRILIQDATYREFDLRVEQRGIDYDDRTPKPEAPADAPDETTGSGQRGGEGSQEADQVDGGAGDDGAGAVRDGPAEQAGGPGAADAAADGPDGATGPAGPGQSGVTTLFQKAFHGTPHDVDRFDLNFIGTGEGVQAFGWGLYFAQRKGIAEHYRQSISGSADGTITFDGMDMDSLIDDKSVPITFQRWAQDSSGGAQGFPAFVKLGERLLKNAVAGDDAIVAIHDALRGDPRAQLSVMADNMNSDVVQLFMGGSIRAAAFEVMDEWETHPTGTPLSDVGAVVMENKDRKGNTPRSQLNALLLRADDDQTALKTAQIGRLFARMAWEDRGISAIEDGTIEDRMEVDEASRGNLLTVELQPDEDEYLLLDEPFSGQSEKVQAALRSLPNADVILAVNPLTAKMKRRDGAPPSGLPDGNTIYRRMSQAGQREKLLDSNVADKEASLALLAVGIQGNKFQDNSSRGKSPNIPTFHNWLETVRPELGDSTFNGVVNQETGVPLSREEVIPLEEAYDNFVAEIRAKHDAKRTFNYVLFDDTRVDITKREQKKRGSVTFGPPDKHGRRAFRVDFFAAANRSTFFHEMGHIWLEMLGDIVETGIEGVEIPQQVLDDYQGILEFLGAENRAGITEKMHEKWARSFETYIAEGKAPSSALREMFMTFRKWMERVYKSLVEIDAPLSQPIREIMDRLVATDEQIKEAQFELGVPLPDSVLADLTDAQRARYDRRIQRERDEADLRLTREVMKRVSERQRLRRGEFMDELRDKVEGELNEHPAVIAVANMRDGTQPNGEDLEAGVEQVFLDRAAVLDLYGPESPVLAALAEMGLLADDGGLTPAQAFEVFGMSSGDELLRSMVLLADKDAAVEKGAEARFKTEAPPELLTSPEIGGMRRRLTATETRSERILADLRLLKAKAKDDSAIPTLKVIRARAQRQLAGRTIREIRPHAMQQASRWWARKAWERAGKGDFEVAAEAKSRELLNHEMYRIALKIREKARKHEARAKRLGKPRSLDNTGKAGFGHRDQLIGLISRFGFTRIQQRPDPRHKSLESWLEQNDAETGGLAPDIPQWLLNEQDRRDWKDLTPEELQDVRDAMDQIHKVATNKHKILDANRKTTIADEVLGVEASILAWAERTGKSKKGKRLRGDRPGKVKRFLASHRAIDSIARDIDGGSFGALFRAFIRPKNDAQTSEINEGVRINEGLTEVFELLTDDDTRMWSERTHLDGLAEDLTLEQRFMVAMNYGNKEGRLRLENSFTPQEIQIILNSLEERHARAAQKAIELMDSFWPESRSLWEQIKGVAPPKVEALPFITTDAKGSKIEWTGGYHRIKYAGVLQLHETSLDQQAQQIKSGATIRSTTKSGSLKERLENVEHELRFDFAVVTSHLAEVVHMNTHLIPLRDMQAVLDGARDTMVEHLGEETYDQFRAMYKDLAAGTYAANDTFGEIMQFLRVGQTVMRLGWRITTNLINVSGLSQSFPAVGGKDGSADGARRVLEQMAKLMRQPLHIGEVVARVHELSAFMKTRSISFEREIAEQLVQFKKLRPADKIARVPGIPSSVAAGIGTLVEGVDRVARSSFIPLGWTQAMVDIPTWLAAFDKATEKGLSESQAVAVADDVVTAGQGSGRIGDMARIMRGGEMQKLFTTFYGYATRTMNLSAEVTGRTKFRDPLSVMRWAGEMMMLLGIPAITAILVQRGIRGDPGEEDETLAGEVGREMLAYTLGMFVGLREFGGLAIGIKDYTGPAGASVFGEVGKLYEQVGQGVLDDTLLKRMLTVSGILLHLPTTQLNESYRGLKAYLAGEAGILAPIVGAPKGGRR